MVTTKFEYPLAAVIVSDPQLLKLIPLQKEGQSFNSLQDNIHYSKFFSRNHTNFLDTNDIQSLEKQSSGIVKQ